MAEIDKLKKEYIELSNDTPIDLLEAQLSSPSLREWLEDPTEDIYPDE